MHMFMRVVFQYIGCKVNCESKCVLTEHTVKVYSIPGIR